MKEKPNSYNAARQSLERESFSQPEERQARLKQETVVSV